MSEPKAEIKIIDYRAAYYLRKGVMEEDSKEHLRERIKGVTNRNLMYGITFFERMN